MDHASSNQFVRRGIEKGDRLYIVSCFENTLFLMGDILVDKIYSARKAAKKLNRSFSEVNWATDHVIIDRKNADPIYFDVVVSLAKVRKLRFVKNGSVRLQEPKFKDPATRKIIEPQTFRNIRQISDETAEILDSILNKIR